VDGFLNLHKPSGWTSHDCVAKVRRILQQKKVGHGGTLDPMATGVLPIALGRATRLIQYLPGDKAYRATVRFGLTTSTDDIEGETIATHPTDGLTSERAIAALDRFLGTIEQIPPKYSAIQVGGQRLYDLARAGADVDVPVRTVTVSAIEVGDWRGGLGDGQGDRQGDRQSDRGEYPELDLTIACGAGTYIRAIARDLGEAVGTGATLSRLERTLSSGLDLTTSLTIEALADRVAAETFAPISPNVALAALPAIAIDESVARRWRLGQKVTIDPAIVAECGEAEVVRVCGPSGDFFGIARYDRATMRLLPKMVYAPA